MITIEIPQEYYKDSGRIFSVIRLYDGNAALLKDLDNQADTVTIWTDEFSYYALAYMDGTNTVGTPIAGQTGNGSNASGTSAQRGVSPETGDVLDVGMYLGLCIAMAVMIIGIYIKNRQTRRDML